MSTSLIPAEEEGTFFLSDAAIALESSVTVGAFAFLVEAEARERGLYLSVERVRVPESGFRVRWSSNGR